MGTTEYASQRRHGRHRLHRHDREIDCAWLYHHERGIPVPTANPERDVATIARRAVGRSAARITQHWLHGRTVRLGDQMDRLGEWTVAGIFWLCAAVAAVLLLGALVLLII